jgi:hypothetical protein
MFRTWCRIVAFALIVSVLTSCGSIDYMTSEGEAKRIRKIGKRADAQILEIWDTGMTLNNNPVVGFKLQVRPSGGENYEAQTKALISRLAIPQIQPGAVIPVSIDPEDQSKVAINMSKE